MSARDQPIATSYVQFSGSAEWTALDRAVRELAENRHLVETTAHEYVVGYLCQALATTGPQQTPQAVSRIESLHRVRDAVKESNPGRRDLVAELLEERRVEANRG
jgi:hypothetical protein